MENNNREVEKKENKDLKDKSFEESPKRNLKGRWGTLVTIISVVFSLYHIYALGITTVTPIILRSIFLLGTSILIFLLIPATKRSPQNRVSLVDLIWIMCSVVAFFYLLKEGNNLLWRIGAIPSKADVIFGFLIALIILETTRRCVGWTLPIIAIIFFLYAILGPYIPGYFGHHGYSFERVVGYIMGLDGILGLPTGVASTYVFLFIIFGAFLHRFGGGDFFIELATALFGGTRGGPAKIAVVASSFFGTISGSAVANTVGTGSFTIPLMKKVGYKKPFAGAVEAVASTGGQIMPPIMGAGAFVIADIVGIPYLSVAAAALIPALLYYTAVFLMVDLEAVKLGLLGVPKDQLPSTKKVLLRRGYLLIPVFVLVYMLVIVRSSPIRAALIAILSMVIIAVVVKGIRHQLNDIPVQIIDSLKTAAVNVISVGATCACAGFVVGVIGLTGLGIKLASLIIAIAEHAMFPALLAGMIVAIILGMGLPTTPAYIIGAAVVAPALVRLGILPIQSHLFTFYFACIAVITPPIALAAYAGAGIAGAKPLEVGFQAVKLGIVAFIIPYAFIYDASLLGLGGMTNVAISFSRAFLGVIALACGLQRRFYGRVEKFYWRFLLIIGSLLLIIKPGTYTTCFGVILIVIVFIKQWFKNRQNVVLSNSISND